MSLRNYRCVGAKGLPGRPESQVSVGPRSEAQVVPDHFAPPESCMGHQAIASVSSTSFFAHDKYLLSGDLPSNFTTIHELAAVPAH